MRPYVSGGARTRHKPDPAARHTRKVTPMTTPEARPAAPIVFHYARDVALDPEELAAVAETYADGDCGAVRLDRDGQLWQREAARDVQAHGEPGHSPTRREKIRRLYEQSHRQSPKLARQGIDLVLETRRPAMRAARAELDALNGSRRLEPEPSAMGRTGLALGLAFTTSHRATSGRHGQPSTDLAPGA